MRKIMLFIARVLVTCSPELVSELLQESSKSGENIDDLIYLTVWGRRYTK